MLHLLSPEIQMIDNAKHHLSLPIEQVNACNTLPQAVTIVAEIYDFQWHPYFLWMRSVNVDRAEFLQSQLPFRYAVETFSQALAAVNEERGDEERGDEERGDEERGDGNLLRSHKATFRQYLYSLGATNLELEYPASIGVLAFNQSILNYCLTQSPECGAAMLGMIEHLYVNISGTIARMVYGCAWAQPGSQSHYTVHPQLDVDHARDLWQIAQTGWDNTDARPQVAQSLLLGAHYFWSLYEDMQPHD
jgi:pyrroloquinoline-quinone synthase